MADQEFVYHGVPADLCGDVLLPLNRLRVAYLDLGKRYLAKYQGREGAPLRPVAPLGCTVGDVLMFSPVHPADLRAAMEEAGRPWVARRHWFAVDAARHFRREDTVLLLPGGDPTAPVFVPYEPGSLAHYRAVSERQRQKYRETPADKPVLLFSGTVHVLHRGAIPLDGLTVVEA
jgi:hypothetical protein